MISSKNLYNYLNILKLNLFVNTETFFVVEDSLNILFIKYLKQENCSIQLISKFILKLVSFSAFVPFNFLKFPLYLFIFKFFFYFEKTFLIYFFTFNNSIFFKSKKQIFNLLLNNKVVLISSTYFLQSQQNLFLDFFYFYSFKRLYNCSLSLLV